MAVLTADQIAYYQRKLGSNFDQDDVSTRIDRLTADGLYTGDIDVVIEVLEIRQSTLAGTPETFAIPGEYSQSTVGNMKLLDRQIAEALAEKASGQDIESGFVFIQEPVNVRPARIHLDTEEQWVRGHRFRCGR